MKAVTPSGGNPGGQARRLGMTPAQATATAAVAFLLTAAACSGTGSGVVYNSNFTAGYVPGSLRAAMSRAPLLVETYGTPGHAQAQEGVRSEEHTSELQSLMRISYAALCLEKTKK